jgi:UDP-3-O-[3-hydroxymyristoyl] glucosamine N-acyltransferase
VSTLKHIASMIEGEVIGDPMVEITGVSEIQNGKPDTITFLGNLKYRKYLNETSASAVITNDPSFIDDKNGIVVQNPTWAIGKILDFFYPQLTPTKTIHESAIIHPEANLGKNVTIEAGVVIEAGANIDDDVWIGANTVIGRTANIGSESKLHANVTVYRNVEIGARAIIHSGAVIGSDGFGFTTIKGQNIKISHTGNVIIGDDVEIGACTSIDRGTIGNTVIENNVKLDNQIQIAHNVKIGESCLIAAGARIAGSSEIGHHSRMGGMSGVVDSVKVGPHSTIASTTAVTKSLPGNQMYAGNPAREIREQHKRDAVFTEISRIKKRLDQLQNQVKTD